MKIHFAAKWAQVLGYLPIQEMHIHSPHHGFWIPTHNHAKCKAYHASCRNVDLAHMYQAPTVTKLDGAW